MVLPNCKEKKKKTLLFTTDLVILPWFLTPHLFIYFLRANGLYMETFSIFGWICIKQSPPWFRRGFTLCHIHYNVIFFILIEHSSLQWESTCTARDQLIRVSPFDDMWICVDFIYSAFSSLFAIPLSTVVTTRHDRWLWEQMIALPCDSTRLRHSQLCLIAGGI